MLAAMVRIRSTGPKPPANRFRKTDAAELAGDRRGFFLSAIQEFFS